MRAETEALLERLRRSRGQITRAHFEALLADAADMGAAALLEAIEARLVPPPSRSQRAAQPLQEAFLRAEQRAYFPVRREFVDAVVEEAVGAHGPSFDLPTRARTMPGLLRHYASLCSEDELAELLRRVGEKHAHTR